jgi:hypothetical protein
MNLSPSGHAVSATADTLTAESETPLEPVEIDATRGVEIDFHFVCHCPAPNPRG